MNVIVNLRGRAFAIRFERDVDRANFKAFPEGEGTTLREATDWLAERIPRSAEDTEAGYFRVTHGQAVKLISLLMESPAAEGETIR
jgi:hypothetical protein